MRCEEAGVILTESLSGVCRCLFSESVGFGVAFENYSMPSDPINPIFPSFPVPIVRFTCIPREMLNKPYVAIVRGVGNGGWPTFGEVGDTPVRVGASDGGWSGRSVLTIELRGLVDHPERGFECDHLANVIVSLS